MPTPDNSQTLKVRCKTIGCPNIPIRWYEYCAPCNAEERSARTDRARHAKMRMSRKPDIVDAAERIRPFADLLALPSSPGARRDAIWEELVRLDHLLERHGPANFKLRSEVRTRAAAIREHLVERAEKKIDDAYQYIHATELLADVGTESPVDVLTLRRYAAESVAFYTERDDRPRLARSILLYANTWRLVGYERKAGWIMRSALHILEEWCNRKDPQVTWLLHNALLHNLRLLGHLWSDGKREAARESLLSLASTVDTPSVWLETHRELVNYWNKVGLRDRAMKEYDALRALRQKYRFPEYGIFSLNRPKVHVLLESGIPKDRHEALELIERECLGIYLDDSHCYYYDVLRNWKRQFPELAFHLPEPTYGAVILTYLPRNKVDGM